MGFPQLCRVTTLVHSKHRSPMKCLLCSMTYSALRLKQATIDTYDYRHIGHFEDCGPISVLATVQPVHYALYYNNKYLLDENCSAIYEWVAQGLSVLAGQPHYLDPQVVYYMLYVSNRTILSLRSCLFRDDMVLEELSGVILCPQVTRSTCNYTTASRITHLPLIYIDVWFVFISLADAKTSYRIYYKKVDMWEMEHESFNS